MSIQASMATERGSWSSPVAGARWIRTWRIGEWLHEPVSPLFASLLLPILANAREIGGGSAVGAALPKMWRLRDPAYCIVNGFYFARVDPDPVSAALLPVRFLTTEIRGGWLERWRTSIRPAYLDVLQQIAGDLRTADHARLSEHMRALAGAAAKVWYVLALSAGGSIPLSKFLAGIAGRDADPADIAALTAGFDAAVQKEQQSLFAIAGAMRDAQLEDRIDEYGVHAFLRLSETDNADTSRFRSLLRQHMVEFGHLVDSLDFRVPTIAEEPNGLGIGIKCYLHSPRNPNESFARTIERRQEATERLSSRLRSVKLRLFRRLLVRAQGYAQTQADAAFQLQRAWPLFREGLLRIGSGLAERGMLESADDVFFLTADDLRTGQMMQGPREAARARRSLWMAQRELVPPSSIPLLDDPAWNRAMKWPIDVRRESLHLRRGDRTLVGTGASAGRAEGRARVLGFASEIEHLRSGEILVTSATTPNWTPAFARAAGVVTDVGGMASHASIVAREFGIPAVVGTREATRRISTGEVIIVDGMSGIVEVRE